MISEYKADSGSTILEILNQNEIAHPQICHVPEVDPIQTCDTCIVEVDGKLVRSCSTIALDGMTIQLDSPKVKTAQTEAMDRILENHLLYCTVCDNNNGNCKLHNTAEFMEIEHQKYPYTPKVSVDEVDCLTPSIDTTLTNVSRVDNVWKCVKTYKSTKHYPLTGKPNVLASFGMLEQVLMIPLVSAVDNVSRFVLVTP